MSTILHQSNSAPQNEGIQDTIRSGCILNCTTKSDNFQAHTLTGIPADLDLDRLAKAIQSAVKILHGTDVGVRVHRRADAVKGGEVQ